MTSNFTRTAATGMAGAGSEAASARSCTALASIVAREEFLTALKNLSEQFGVQLRKGAGAPTDASAREFVRMHGWDPLGQVAKLHFKNTQKIRV